MEIVLKKDACVFTTTVSDSVIIVFPSTSLTKYSISTFTASMLWRLKRRTSIVTSEPAFIFLSTEIGLRFVSKRTSFDSISTIMGISLEPFPDLTISLPT